MCLRALDALWRACHSRLWTATNHDLGERARERNTKLFESEQRFRLMVDGLQDYCLYFLDELGHLTD